MKSRLLANKIRLEFIRSTQQSRYPYPPIKFHKINISFKFRQRPRSIGHIFAIETHQSSLNSFSLCTTVLSMSKTTKKKFVTSQLVQQIVELGDGQFVGKILSSRGNNLHAVQTADDENFLVSMPTKFRKTLWVRRGNFVILHPIEEGDKVRAEIVHVLDPENIAFLMEKKQWPAKFAADAELLTNRRGATKADEEADAKDDMFPPSSSEEEEDDDDEEEEVCDEEEDEENTTDESHKK